MTCRELTEFLMDYLEGELPEAQRATFAQHVELCPPCLTYLKTYQEAVDLGRSVCSDASDALPADVPEELVRAILATRARPS